MSAGEIVLAAAVLLSGGVVAYALHEVASRLPVHVQDGQDGHQRPVETSREPQRAERPAEPAEAAEQPSAPQSALPVDPANPPTLRTYRRREGRPVQRCHCHDRELVDGEQVTLWPQPGGSMLLLCEEAMQR